MEAPNSVAVQGATANIIAAYFAYGLTVQHVEGYRRGQVTCLDRENVNVQLGAHHYCAWHYDRCLPVLRSFADLCTPLGDGTIPAVEVAKMVMQANRPEGRTPIASYGIPVLRGTDKGISVDCHRDTSYTLELLLDATWAVCTVYDFGIVYAHNMLAVHDYLRSQHFALPVNGRSLVEGKDYIRKAC